MTPLYYCLTFGLVLFSPTAHAWRWTWDDANNGTHVENGKGAQSCSPMNMPRYHEYTWDPESSPPQYCIRLYPDANCEEDANGLSCGRWGPNNSGQEIIRSWRVVPSDENDDDDDNSTTTGTETATETTGTGTTEESTTTTGPGSSVSPTSDLSTTSAPDSSSSMPPHTTTSPPNETGDETGAPVTTTSAEDGSFPTSAPNAGVMIGLLAGAGLMAF